MGTERKKYYNVVGGDNQGMIIQEGRGVIDPAGAEFILRHAGFTGQRRIVTQHVKTLAGLMTDNDWRPDEQITFCALGPKLVLVNGYHRLHAVIHANVDQTFALRILPVQSEEELRRVYATFDTVDRKRNSGEVVRALGVLEAHGLDKLIGAAAYRAVPLLMNGLRAINKHEAEKNMLRRADVASGYWAYAKTYQDMIAGADRASRIKLALAGVTAVALLTIKHQPERAAQFWPRVADRAGLAARDPRLVLAGRLSNPSRYKTHGNVGEFPRTVLDSALAWNAWNEGREVQLLRPGTELSIWGTGFRQPMKLVA